MKISCHREQLLQAFQAVASVAPARSPKPVLQNVRVDATPEQVVLSATDLEIGIRYVVSGVEVSTPGQALLPVTRFGAILREGTDEQLQLEADGQGTTIRGQRSQFTLSGANPSEFPQVASFAEESYVEVGGRLLRELIRRTSFATDNESSRYALGGVRLELDDNALTAVGTDGRRLAKMTGPVSVHGTPSELGQNTIVPTKAMQLIERTLGGSESDVKATVRGNEFQVQSERALITARLLEGRFPDWRKVFPNVSDATQIELAVGPTLSAVRQAAIVTSDESRGVDFHFDVGMLTLSGRAAEVGQARVELPIGYDGPELSIALDPRFVVDFLKVIDADKTFHMELQDSEAAAVCKTDDGYGYVIMPLARDR
ncbi:MAG: DNA polymerase III subunit beta [Planctomycetales bacterium]|nr:DNA polymerase III subunit beta [Planctomycetales bacterium]